MADDADPQIIHDGSLVFCIGSPVAIELENEARIAVQHCRREPAIVEFPIYFANSSEIPQKPVISDRCISWRELVASSQRALPKRVVRFGLREPLVDSPEMPIAPIMEGRQIDTQAFLAAPPGDPASRGLS